MTQPSPVANAEPVAPRDLEALIEEAQKLPGVAEAIALMETISVLIPPPPAQLTVTRYATGGNVPDAHVG
jgi:hypothetical protein